MKTISKRFLKASVAMLLVVIMLFGSTISGLAAVVDNADTKVNSSGGHIYFVKPSSWKKTIVEFCIGHDGWTSTYKMTHLSGNLYYLDLRAANDNKSWDGNTYHCVMANDNDWGQGNWGYSNISGNANNYTSEHSDYAFNNSETYLITCTSNAEKNATISTVWKSKDTTQYDTLNSNQTAECKLKNADGTYSDSTSAGTITVTGYALTGNGSGSSSTNTKSASATSVSRKAAQGTTVTMKATASSGNNFEGWYSGSTLVTTASEYSYTCTGSAKTYTARFAPSGYSYTVSAGEGGTITSATSGTATSVQVEATANTGYKFKEWQISVGTTQTTETSIEGKVATATFTLTAAATINAVFEKTKTEVTLSAEDATNTYTTSVDATYGEDMPAITPPTKAGCDFMGYFTMANGEGDKYYNENGESVKKWNKEDKTITLYAHFVTKTYTLTMDSNGTTSKFEVDNATFENEAYYTTTVDHGKHNVTVYSLWEQAGMVISKITVNNAEEFNDTTGYTKSRTLTNLDITSDTVIKVDMEQRGKLVSFSDDGETTKSYYVEVGAELTDIPKAKGKDGYEFVGWCVGDNTDTVNFETFTVSDDTTLNAKYRQITFTLTINFPLEGVESVTVLRDDVLYGTYEDTTTIEGLPYGSNMKFTVNTTDDYRADGTWTSSISGINIEDGKEVTLELNNALTITPDITKVYTVTVDGVALNKKYAENETVTHTCTNISSNQYIDSIEGLPEGTEYELIGENGFSFTMPEGDVDITVNLGTYYYITLDDDSKVTVNTDLSAGFVEGEDVEFTISANTGATLNGVSYILIGENGEEVPVTVEPVDNKCVVSLTMPAYDVEIIVDASAQHKVSYEMLTIGNYGTGDTSGYGEVVIRDAKGNTVDNNDYAEQGKVSFTAKVLNDKFTFAGFYKDSNCTEPYSNYAATCDIDITGETKVYALFARKQYITYDTSNTSERQVKEIFYNPEKKNYTHITTHTGGNSYAGAIANGAWFRVTNNNTGNGWNNYISYNTSQFKVEFLGGIKSEDGCWKFNNLSGEGLVEITLTPTWNSKISAKATAINEANKTKVYLSSGRRDLTDRKSQTVSSSSRFISTHVTGGGAIPIDRSWGDGDDYYHYNVESYTIGLVDSADISQQITVETTIEGQDKGKFYVKTYVIFHSDGYIEEVPSSPKGNDTYETTFNIVDGKNCIVTPIFWYTDEYANSNGKKAITVYFDRSEVPTNWGPFVSCYPYGYANNSNSSSDLMGGWPGQLMIPSYPGKDVNKFYTQFVVDTATFTPQAVAFSNYMWSSTPNAKKSEFGLDGIATNFQTYDYGEPIYLYNEGFTTITFKLKQDKQGHRYSGEQTNAKGNYTYQVLVNESGEPMSLTAHVVNNPQTAANADFYILAGEQKVTIGSYTPDTSYAGEWSTMWTIFKKDGTKIDTYLSGSIYDEIGEEVDNNPKSVLVQKLIEKLRDDAEYSGMSDEQIYDKLSQATVAICYNQERNDNGATRFDGQWYGSRPDKKYTISVEATLLENGTYKDSGTNIASFGKAFVSGDKATDEIVVNEYAQLSATELFDGNDYYHFVGWFIKGDNNNYLPVETRSNFNAKVDSNQTYYAVFEKLAKNTLIVKQEKYLYKGKDTSIYSHDGVSSLYVEIQQCTEDGTVIGDVLDHGDWHSYESKASCTVVKDQFYKVTLKAKPAPGSKFYAWYAKDDEMNYETYEEVLTEKEFDKDELAETSFIYQATGEPQGITIYADTETPGMKTTLVYHYLDRYGDPTTYTVRNVRYNDDEIIGYPGNGGTPYSPTYITKYEVKKPGDSTTEVCYGDDELKKYQDLGYTMVSSYNMIQKHAPDKGRTVVFDSDLKWDIITTGNKANINPGSQITHLTAVQDDPVYVVNYEYNGTTGYVSGKYNTLIDNKIIADKVNGAGVPFSHWEEVITDPDTNQETTKIISYYLQYNYRITEHKTIRAVYEADDTEKWTPTIDSVIITRELEDGIGESYKDTIYTDYLITYSNSKGKELDAVKESEKIRYGLMLIYDPDVAKYNTTANSYVNKEFVQLDTIAEEVKGVAKGGKSKTIYDDDNNNHKYNVYCFDLTERDTTNFNRLDYYLMYDNLQKKYDKYNFTAVAYIIVGDNEPVLSNTEFVNFYKEANSEVMQ